MYLNLGWIILKFRTSLTCQKVRSAIFTPEGLCFIIFIHLLFSLNTTDVISMIKVEISSDKPTLGITL